MKSPRVTARRRWGLPSSGAEVSLAQANPRMTRPPTGAEGVTDAPGARGAGLREVGEGRAAKMEQIPVGHSPFSSWTAQGREVERDLLRGKSCQI